MINENLAEKLNFKQIIAFMKILFLTFFFSTYYILTAQEPKLFLTKENDSTLSVRDDNNKIIIPPYHYIGYIPEKKEELKTDILLIAKSPVDYELYDRLGKFLYKASVFDFMAEFQEGHIPIVQNEKEGLINKEGKLIIPAEYDWMGFLTNGFVEACKDCYFDRTKDPEHPPLVGGTWFLIDKYGEIKDQQLYGKQLKTIDEYPNQYTEEAQLILNGINQYLDAVSEKLKITDGENKFEIVYNPTQFNPNYEIKLYSKSLGKWASCFDSESNYNFEYDPKTKTYYGFYQKNRIFKKHGEEIFETKKIKIPIRKWLKNKSVTSN